MEKYKIELTKKQAETVMTACEVLARLGIGQYRDALEYLPLRDVPDWNADLDMIGGILSRYTQHGVDGWQTSLSIHSADTSDEAKTAWDIYQVIRHKLAWRMAVADGIAESDNPDYRDWNLMGGRCYDGPQQIGPEPLPEMEGVD